MKSNLRFKCICLIKRVYFKPSEFIHSYCLGIDVVGYSKHTTNVQLAIVKRIQEIVEDSNSLKRVSRQHIVFLPTGDGMIICLLGQINSPKITIDLAAEIQKILIEENKNKCEENRIIVRIGIHSGTGSSYLDINRNLNIAGHVANMTQRVMSFGNDWHIIASKNAFDDIGTLSTETRGLFHYIGMGEAKHKQMFELYNVYCEGENSFGNPVRPIGIIDVNRSEFTGQ